ncbi:NRDE family protein [Ulvibacter litoralis]|uniref:Transport and Golgi organisation 2 n=1 Tax=Ulvibacter litoralis TaxID=227084 RepID=A0A1G7GHD7_9FLAO|nr:NRDE family protein [Ulvibacter litoralis]GHC56232.1 hypothetical protein GCM10008083_20890 [Ulvibacter litoralis]SDE87429.1 Transport and Golgi organisation 2 [Ulvibacter litoralis]
MCTVTFIPTSNTSFVLTSSRDEAPNRKTITPELYSVNGANLLFPKDAVAGGTWIGVSSKKRLICLLNGGFTAHERAESYRMSRGIIVTDLLTSEDFVTTVHDYDFTGIEPFTIVCADWNEKLQLFELVWDGSTVHFAEKPLKPYIWSSSLLYSEAMKEKRISWFSDLLKHNSTPSEADMLQFHKTAGDGNLASNVIMDRGFVKTKSITQFSKAKEKSMRYEDLETGMVTESIL